MDENIIRNVALVSWVAGHFEGEGTVSIVRSGKRGYTRPIVTLTSTDRQVIDVIQDRWPGCVKTYQPKGNARPAHRWTLNVRPAIARFLWDMMPLLKTERVRRKAELVLEDIGARVQGARGEDYLAQCHERREQIRALNHRGVA
jgi:hypothetical protein